MFLDITVTSNLKQAGEEEPRGRTGQNVWRLILNSKDINKRSGRDRRSGGIPGIKTLFTYHRRKAIRREEDVQRFIYFDQYGVRIFMIIVFVLFLSVVDALLTLFLVDWGASEMNPIMAYYLQLGPNAFIFAKYLFTSFSLIILLIFSNYYIRKINIHVRSLFQYTAVLFTLVIGWELVLVLRILH